MKNIFLALIIASIILAIVPLGVHADEIFPEEVTTTIEETPTETPQEPPTSEEMQEVASLLDRIQEAWEKGEIKTVISLAFDVAILIVAFFLKKVTGKSKTLGHLLCIGNLQQWCAERK